MTIDDDQPATAAAGNDDTTIVPPATEMGQWAAWSVDEPATVALSRPWRSVWAIAGIGLFSGVVIAFAVFGVVALLKDDGPSTTPAQPTAPAASSPMTSAAAPAQPSLTVTAQPPPTVTVMPPPTTVTAQAAPPPAAGGTDVFTIS